MQREVLGINELIEPSWPAALGTVLCLSLFHRWGRKSRPARQSWTLRLIVTRRLKNRIIFKHLWVFPVENFMIGTIAPTRCVSCVCACVQLLNECAAWTPGPPEVMGVNVQALTLKCVLFLGARAMLTLGGGPS